MGSIGETIASSGQLAVGLAEMLAKDIEPRRFALRPIMDGREVETNHPAFVYGHLSLYPADALEVCGIDIPGLKPSGSWVELFQHGKECRSDPEGTIYPRKDELVASLLEGTRAALEAVAGVDDAVLAAPNEPGSWLAQRFSCRGAAVNFYLNLHAMIHLGQVSAWRRCMGLGPVM